MQDQEFEGDNTQPAADNIGLKVQHAMILKLWRNVHPLDQESAAKLPLTLADALLKPVQAILKRFWQGYCSADL